MAAWEAKLERLRQRALAAPAVNLGSYIANIDENRVALNAAIDAVVSEHGLKTTVFKCVATMVRATEEGKYFRMLMSLTPLPGRALPGKNALALITNAVGLSSEPMVTDTNAHWVWNLE